jgi:hypothetical protein
MLVGEISDTRIAFSRRWDEQFQRGRKAGLGYDVLLYQDLIAMAEGIGLQLGQQIRMRRAMVEELDAQPALPAVRLHHAIQSAREKPVDGLGGGMQILDRKTARQSHRIRYPGGYFLTKARLGIEIVTDLQVFFSRAFRQRNRQPKLFP